MNLHNAIAACIEQTLNGGLPKHGKVQLLVELNFAEGSLGSVAAERTYEKHTFKGKEIHHEVTTR
jgi:hypothetical protein